VPAGPSTLVFRYAPASFVRGLVLAGLAGAVLLAWLAFIYLARRRTGASSA
jgi:hypothetical protein